MTPRPKRHRNISQPPQVKGFRPFGPDSMASDPVYLLVEEYEAIKLSDYDGLDQLRAAEKMDVSRPTFTRIYEKARRKIARAFTEARPVIIEGGSVRFNEEWYRCNHCGITHRTEHSSELEACKLCSSKELLNLNDEMTAVAPDRQVSDKEITAEKEGFCVCPVCMERYEHFRGIPCKTVFCEKCGVNLYREGTTPLKNILNKRKETN